MFCFKLIGAYFEFDTHCFIRDYLWKHICIIGWCLVRQRNSWARPSGLKNLYPSKILRL